MTVGITISLVPFEGGMGPDAKLWHFQAVRQQDRGLIVGV